MNHLFKSTLVIFSYILNSPTFLVTHVAIVKAWPMRQRSKCVGSFWEILYFLLRRETQFASTAPDFPSYLKYHERLCEAHILYQEEDKPKDGKVSS